MAVDCNGLVDCQAAIEECERGLGAVFVREVPERLLEAAHVSGTAVVEIRVVRAELPRYRMERTIDDSSSDGQLRGGVIPRDCGAIADIAVQPAIATSPTAKVRLFVRERPTIPPKLGPCRRCAHARRVSYR
jgi:hypothetical protein